MQENKIFDLIQKEISENDIVIFMKGTANFPQCGFSSKVVHMLRKIGVSFKDINVLADETLRQGIKDFSEWPTVPQVFVKGEFIGGCDIMREMFENGELETLLKEKNIL